MVDLKKKLLTPFARHRIKWNACTACPLCKTRLNVVLARGQVPCDILFIGEAPGASEDVIGQPFVGPAGRLLDDIIKASVPGCTEMSKDGCTEVWCCNYRIAFTNLVCCIPVTGGDKNEPPLESIKACAPRLVEFMVLCRPKLIVTVGKLSDKWAGRATEGMPLPKWASIVHPAAILRMDSAQRGLAVQRCVATLGDAVASL